MTLFFFFFFALKCRQFSNNPPALRDPFYPRRKGGQGALQEWGQIPSPGLTVKQGIWCCWSYCYESIALSVAQQDSTAGWRAVLWAIKTMNMHPPPQKKLCFGPQSLGGFWQEYTGESFYLIFLDNGILQHDTADATPTPSPHASFVLHQFFKIVQTSQQQK